MDKKERIEKLAHDAHEKGGFTGAWLYAENGEIVSAGAIGVNDFATGAPITADMVFDLASISKQFTATAVMLLKRKGLLSLDDEITKFFPEVPFPGVTVYHLLTHTGGLPDYMDWCYQTAKAEHTIPKNDIVIRFLKESGKKAEFAPGEQWEYSNTGYCVLAQIVEKVAGEPFETFLEKNIFIPAGMTATKVYHRRKDGITIPNLALGMIFEDGRWILPDDSKSKDSNDVVPLDGMNGDGLVHSNVFDLFRWDKALREEKVLTKEEQEMMRTPAKLNSGELAVDDDEDGHPNYGFGWDILNDPQYGTVVFHSGSWTGYYSWYERFLDADKVLVFLRCRSKVDARACEGFYAGTRAIATGREPAPVRSIEEVAIQKPDKTKWENFCGKYEKKVEDFPIEEVYSKDGDLYMKVVFGEDEVYDFRLYPIVENRFGRKGGLVEITFGDNCLVIDGIACKKINKEDSK